MEQNTGIEANLETPFIIPIYGALMLLTGDSSENVTSPLDPLSKSIAWKEYIMLPTGLV